MPYKGRGGGGSGRRGRVARVGVENAHVPLARLGDNWRSLGCSRIIAMICPWRSLSSQFGIALIFPWRCCASLCGTYLGDLLCPTPPPGLAACAVAPKQVLDDLGLPRNGWEEKLLLQCRRQMVVAPKRGQAVLFYNQHPDGRKDLVRTGLCRGFPPRLPG